MEPWAGKLPIEEPLVKALICLAAVPFPRLPLTWNDYVPWLWGSPSVPYCVA